MLCFILCSLQVADSNNNGKNEFNCLFLNVFDVFCENRILSTESAGCRLVGEIY